MTKRHSLFTLLALLTAVGLACQATAAPEPTATATSASEEVSAPSGPSLSLNAPVALPATRANHAGDQDSSVDAHRNRVPGGDAFVRNLYERPFNADSMDTYYPYLDIVDTQGFKDDTWGYATITLSDTDAGGGLPGSYGVELDLNKDGRGEWLFLAANPASTEWTTTGVRAWHDADGDIGGPTALYADEGAGGNGYETLMLDQDTGENQDGAWVRRSSEDPKTLQIAFRLDLIGGPDSFIMGAWAGAEALDPSRLDFNDHLTHAEAGSPLPDFFVYPLKELAQVDNTCRMAIDFAPRGDEPGLCQTITNDPEVAGCPTSSPALLAVPCP